MDVISQPIMDCRKFMKPKGVRVIRLPVREHNCCSTLACQVIRASVYCSQMPDLDSDLSINDCNTLDFIFGLLSFRAQKMTVAHQINHQPINCKAIFKNHDTSSFIVYPRPYSEHVCKLPPVKINSNFRII